MALQEAGEAARVFVLLPHPQGQRLEAALQLIAGMGKLGFVR
jgi:hypothetical protein